MVLAATEWPSLLRIRALWRRLIDRLNEAHVYEPGVETMQTLIFVLVVLGGLLMAILGERIGRKLIRRPPKLKPFYLRLSRTAPQDPCPCGQAGSSERTYEECCRPGDVENLEQEVKQFIWTDWMKRSGGRSRARSMRLRLQDFPTPEFSLPEWVTHPEEHTFPIDDEKIRAWTPLRKEGESPQVEPTGAELGGDLPL